MDEYFDWHYNSALRLEFKKGSIRRSIQKAHSKDTWEVHSKETTQDHSKKNSEGPYEGYIGSPFEGGKSGPIEEHGLKAFEIQKRPGSFKGHECFKKGNNLMCLIFVQSVKGLF